MPADWDFFGFGSFYTGQAVFNDIDILAVSPDYSPESMRTFSALRMQLQTLSEKIGYRVDLTMLTKSEYLGNPLRDMESLQRLC